jgi:hypothetical protein
MRAQQEREYNKADAGGFQGPIWVVSGGATGTGRATSCTAAPEALAGDACPSWERGYNEAGAFGVPMVHREPAST